MQVVAEKKWREVGSVFKFSATTTSASFVLRKHYFSLLYHYEQVHFFKVQGPLFTPSAPGTSVFHLAPTFFSLANEFHIYARNQLYCAAEAASGSNRSWKPELAIVEYSPKPINDSPDSNAEGK